MKAIVYMKSGLGDIYSFLAMFPELMKEKRWKKEDMKFFVDNIYLLQSQWRFEKNSLIEMLKVAGINNYEIVPIEFSSSGAMDWPNEDAEINGPKLGINFNKNDFLFWRFPQTKEYMRKQVLDDCIFIDNMLTEHTYLWENGEYKRRLDYGRVPLNFIPDEKEKKYIDGICTGKHLLIHIRIKGKAESIADFNRIIKYCKGKRIKCILIGLVSEGYIMPNDNIIDLRSGEEEKISPVGMFYLSEKAKLMVASSSGWTYHRICYNFKDKKTIASYARHRNDYRAIIYKEHLENPNHVFLNADEDNVERIIKEIDRFWEEKDE